MLQEISLGLSRLHLAERLVPFDSAVNLTGRKVKVKGVMQKQQVEPGTCPSTTVPCALHKLVAHVAFKRPLCS